jgi:3-(3-hydroxy-phenyl)propionate hydroxylase
VLAGSAGAEILDSYESERAGSVRAMVNLSRRLGAVIMPTNRLAAGARDAAFACFNQSRRFRSFILRGGVLPPPHIDRSDLTGKARDALVGQMMPQPDVTDVEGTAPLDRRLSIHQWLALGVGDDPAKLLSARAREILCGLGARFACINGEPEASTTRLRCNDRTFLDWARRHKVRGVLVRPDRFIAERLDPRADLHTLEPFAALARRAPTALAGHAATAA